MAASGASPLRSSSNPGAKRMETELTSRCPALGKPAFMVNYLSSRNKRPCCEVLDGQRYPYLGMGQNETTRGPAFAIVSVRHSGYLFLTHCHLACPLRDKLSWEIFLSHASIWLRLSKPMVPFWGRCTTHFILFFVGIGMFTGG